MGMCVCWRVCAKLKSGLNIDDRISISQKSNAEFFS